MLSRSVSIAVLRFGDAVAIVGFFLCFVFGISVLYRGNSLPRTSRRYLA